MDPVTAPFPVYYLPHGGGPWPFMEWPPPFTGTWTALEAFLRGLLADAGARPRAILVVSAHWEAGVPTVTDRPDSELLFDYSGFPPETYRLGYAAPGSPELAARVRGLLGAAGFETAADPRRGLDHGTFVPLMLVAPEPTIPVVQLSLVAGLDPALHLDIGRALARLRSEGVLILGSGMSYHNLREVFSGRRPRGSETFDAWLETAATAQAQERAARLATWACAPDARLAHPREEHLLPLMVAAGAAGADRGELAFRDRLMGAVTSGYRFGDRVAPFVTSSQRGDSMDSRDETPAPGTRIGGAP